MMMNINSNTPFASRPSKGHSLATRLPNKIARYPNDKISVNLMSASVQISAIANSMASMEIVIKTLTIKI